MYATCLHCHGALGANDEIETFPVGRQLAFDAAKGRLWVICPRCSRWNLSALEERWEAVEWCERAYRATSTRVATGEIGLAQTRSGLSLVRIGAPLRPEFAAWRYGRELDTRRRRAWMPRAMNVMLDDNGIVDAATSIGWFLAPSVAIAGALLRQSYRRWYDDRGVPGVRHEGRALSVRHQQLHEMRFTTHDRARWMLVIPHDHGTAHLHGAEALTMLGRLLTHVNDVGGDEQQVQRAVARIEHFGGGERMLDYMASRSGRQQRTIGDALSYEQRLAIEMVAHEETERSAMDGELASLEAAWREAEEVAAIADDLLLPERILRRLRARVGTGARVGG